MRALLLGLVMIAPSLAAADPDRVADPDRMVTDDCALATRAGKHCVLEVDAEEVGGSSPTAGEVDVHALTFVPGASLIRLRFDFIPEILKSAEDM